MISAANLKVLVDAAPTRRELRKWFEDFHIAEQTARLRGEKLDFAKWWARQLR